MAIKIYSCENSRGVRPIWTAEEMGLDYELIMMPFPPRVFMKEYLEKSRIFTEYNLLLTQQGCYQ